MTQPNTPRPSDWTPDDDLVTVIPPPPEPVISERMISLTEAEVLQPDGTWKQYTLKPKGEPAYMVDDLVDIKFGAIGKHKACSYSAKISFCAREDEGTPDAGWRFTFDPWGGMDSIDRRTWATLLDRPRPNEIQNVKVTFRNTPEEKAELAAITARIVAETQPVEW